MNVAKEKQKKYWVKPTLTILVVKKTYEGDDVSSDSIGGMDS